MRTFSRTKYQEQFKCICIRKACIFGIFTLSDIQTIIFLCLPRCGLFPTIQCMCFATGDRDSLFSHGVMEWWKLQNCRDTSGQRQKKGKRKKKKNLHEYYSALTPRNVFKIYWNVSIVCLGCKFLCDPAQLRCLGTFEPRIMQQYIHCMCWQSLPTTLCYSYKRGTRTAVISCLYCDGTLTCSSWMPH